MPSNSKRRLRARRHVKQFAELSLGIALLFANAVWAVEPGVTTGQPQTVHWSLKPVTRLTVPERKAGARNAIDSFIVEKLAASHLSLSPEADRRTLIRRLYFDLTGLPPAPDDVTTFERSKDPQAYEKRVDQLLGSPRYGERWARHWLDVVRFAETHGFEMNQPRKNAWPYRDYVIRAFNEDKPYDRFVREQLAGDALGVDEATGFLVAGPWDQVKSPDPVLTANQRADELHDMVSVTGSTFLGLTVGCARCHNHKFDPIPQTDYYALKACLAGVEHAEREVRSPEAMARAKEADQRRQRLAEVERALEEFEPLAQTESVDTNALRGPVNARLNIERIKPVLARQLRFTINQTTDAEPCLDELEVYPDGPAPRNIALASTGTIPRSSGVFPNSELHRLEHLNDGRLGNSRSWISNERGKGWVELEFPETVTIDRIVWGRDREQVYSDRLALDYQIEVSSGSNDWKLVASSADRHPYTAGADKKPALVLANLNPDQQARANQLLAERQEHEARLKELAGAGMIYAGKFATPSAPTCRLHRGDPMEKREPVLPGALSALSGKYVLTDATNEPARRLALANWIVDPANPLTARVMVNRLWQQHFGEGLVSTPSDFGANGARPTHPELLDWLATEFMQHGWSIKHIHRLILNSAAYRQASAPRQEGLAEDAGSRLLWRFPPRRLEAEAIRDTILAVSGRLDARMGGPGFNFFEPNDNYVRVYNPKKQFGPEDWRRMIYGAVVRQRPDGVFGVFDCPDGGQIAPRRTRSTTPLQALNLLNSEFMLQQAGVLADRLEKESGKDVNPLARRAFALAFQRQPDRDELAGAAKLIREQGLTIFCRALLNANEFVYLF